MQGFWIIFTDGSKGYCEGSNAFDAKGIAEHLTGKTVKCDGDKYNPKLDTLPYPASPVIWQLDHPVDGKCPTFCHSPNQCRGRSSCPQEYSCTE